MGRQDLSILSVSCVATGYRTFKLDIIGLVADNPDYVGRRGTWGVSYSCDNDEAINGMSQEHNIIKGITGSFHQTITLGTKYSVNNVRSISCRFEATDTDDNLSVGYNYSVSMSRNPSPTVPSSISYSSSINGYTSVSIRWGTSTIESGGSIAYVLENSKNNGSFTQIYSGTAKNYYDRLTSSVKTVQYRVKAVCDAVSGDYRTGSVSSVYYNSPPGIPTSLTVPTAIRGGQAIVISWGMASDSNLSGYMLQRAVNGGAFEQVYKGAGRSYTDTAQTSWNTVQYRVNAYDTYSSTSGYKTGDVINVIQNTPPVISGTNTNLGQRTGAFNQPYTVTDADAGQTITIVEKLDGIQRRSFTAVSGTQYNIGVSAAEWLEILNGSHTLTVTAADSYGSSVTRTYTFSKNETAIELQLATPLPASDRILRAIMSVTRTLSDGAIFTVEACNNGNDASPTWVDVTDAVKSGSKFFFANTTKTADKWGFNFKIKVQRNSATGDCFIQGVGGNFE